MLKGANLKGGGAPAPSIDQPPLLLIWSTVIPAYYLSVFCCESADSFIAIRLRSAENTVTRVI